eukprot:4405084-Amphidinium_carterae.1
MMLLCQCIDWASCLEPCCLHDVGEGHDSDAPSESATTVTHRISYISKSLACPHLHLVSYSGATSEADCTIPRDGFYILGVRSLHPSLPCVCAMKNRVATSPSRSSLLAVVG